MTTPRNRAIYKAKQDFATMRTHGRPGGLIRLDTEDGARWSYTDSESGFVVILKHAADYRELGGTVDAARTRDANVARIKEETRAPGLAAAPAEEPKPAPAANVEAAPAAPAAKVKEAPFFAVHSRVDYSGPVLYRFATEGQRAEWIAGHASRYAVTAEEANATTAAAPGNWNPMTRPALPFPACAFWRVYDSPTGQALQALFTLATR